ncbi:peroxiredoxin [Acidiferrimicrobium sp. IK]|uniref:peroxiredoxin n=1 Tax=Acidiferrimicrobium sp. IK TaxID=2871700 RepID=UPI0021CB5167|nr:peroxiredoxin [Acidiferrimicrobium sp. IK]MCU4183241.1 peroxiredoxin [Acidiferrimicrobium sp. IK]
MKPGDQAPDFELADETGTTTRLSDLLARGPVVLFFYPGAMTPVCTKESCHFRDLKAEFDALGAQPVGISADNVDKQKQFADTYSLGFPLLSDRDATVAKAYGVHRSLPGLPNKRATFVIGRDGRVLDVVRSELRASVHADRALEVLGQQAPAGGVG